MSPAERARWLRTAAAWLPTVPALAGTAGAPFVVGALERMARAQAAPLVFHRLSPTRWLIGTDSPAEFEADLVGLRAAWAAIDAGRHAPVRSADFVAPGARRADVIVRKAIRHTAHRWAQGVGCIELAETLDRIAVASGRVIYRPSLNGNAIHTR